MSWAKDVELFEGEKKKTTEEGQKKEIMPWFHNVKTFKEEKERKMQDKEKFQDTEKSGGKI